MQSAGNSNTIKDRELERQGVRVGRSAARWTLIGGIASLPGLALFIAGIVAGIGWMWGFGLAVLFICGGPAVVGLALAGASAVSRWSARHKSFA
jgi:hypothetical protein